MHTKQKHYLYSSFLLVLITAYSLVVERVESANAVWTSFSTHITSPVKPVKADEIFASLLSWSTLAETLTGCKKEATLAGSNYPALCNRCAVQARFEPYYYRITFKKNKKSISKPASDEKTG
jgi:maltodextrin utilization protein YvdJ